MPCKSRETISQKVLEVFPASGPVSERELKASTGLSRRKLLYELHYLRRKGRVIVSSEDRREWQLAPSVKALKGPSAGAGKFSPYLIRRFLASENRLGENTDKWEAAFALFSENWEKAENVGVSASLVTDLFLAGYLECRSGHFPYFQQWYRINPNL